MLKARLFATRSIGDPSIPGLSVRDLSQHAIDNVASTDLADRNARHRDHVIRHDLMRMDQATLRDIGLERDAA